MKRHLTSLIPVQAWIIYLLLIAWAIDLAANVIEGDWVTVGLALCLFAVGFALARATWSAR